MSKKDNGYNYYNLNSNSVLNIDFSHNPEQQEFIRLINTNNIPIICCVGNAGTGKTLCAVTAALDLVKIKKKYSKIVYIREPLEVGKSLGFLPGDVDDKYSSYLGGLYDNLEVISEYSGINKNDMLHSIECIPPQFSRGRSFENTIIIVDEAQNLSLDTIHTLSTRLGKYCKIIFIGSLNQIDIKGKTKENNDFSKAIEVFRSIDLPIFGYIELIKSERSEYCAVIDDAFTKYKENI